MHLARHVTKKILLVAALAALIAAAVWWRGDSQSVNGNQAVQTDGTLSVANQNQPVTFDKNRYSVNHPTSIWVVVNKGRILPRGYVPADLVVPNISLSGPGASENMRLRKDPAAALEKLDAEAKTEGTKLMLVSGYRSFNTQLNVYNSYVSLQGQAFADATSARAGHSEHQTGLAADLGATSRKCQLETCFGDMPEGKWLAANAYKFGFIVRYQKDKHSFTGYDYEPWHLRYVGSELADEIHKSGQTLEEFFDLPTNDDYPLNTYQLKAGL